MKPIRLALLASGSGSNAENICNYFCGSKYLTVSQIVSSRSDAYVHNRAERLGIPSITLSHAELNDGDFLLRFLKSKHIDFIVLAGYLLRVPASVVSAYPNRIVNIHPALLPKFGGKGMYGDFVHQAVVAAEETESGITIHYVNEHYDKGSVIFQAKCPVDPDDAPDDVAAKVHTLEYRYYPSVIGQVLAREFGLTTLVATLQNFIRTIPKAELHLHIEGTLEPELMFQLARRNGIPLKYATIEDVRKAYRFHNLQEFLDLYYEGAAVLLTEDDFHDLTIAYLHKANEQNIRHVEIFFDPQTHTERSVPYETVLKGIASALAEGKKRWSITYRIIPCFLRHLGEEPALETLREIIRFKEHVHGVGLDSSENGFAPSGFQRVFKQAAEEGLYLVAHAGEEGPASYVWEALDLLHVNRIDHGNRSLEDPALVEELVKRQIPLTLCPLSNLKLQVIDSMEKQPAKTMLDRGLLITINSDDPAYFGGYLNENYIALAEACHLNESEIRQLAANSFKASMLNEAKKNFYLKELL
jgi:adenine deaminase